ncbi:MAG: 5'/3'-nucleotidase SurE [Chloroflexi bacterium]|nr:5'/3'-nucleotidase SurE [Chloroflexota bacterium]
MRILVTNDDGIYSRGILALAGALRSVGEVTIVAPDREQSGVSAAITLHIPVRVTQVLSQIDHVKTYAVEGTPSDSVIVALEQIFKDQGPIDLVVSGINEGANLGSDVFLSGTVGAALQAHFRGILAISLSVTSIKDVRFEVAAKIARILAQRARDGLLAYPAFLNVNVPNIPLDEIEGVEMTRLARRTFIDSIEEGHDGKRSYFWISRRKMAQTAEHAEEGTDRWATQSKRISVTPLNVDWTHFESGSSITSVTSSLLKELQASR